MDITLKLTVEEVNVVLNALSARPYAEVVELIGKIQADGQKQLSQQEKSNEE